MTWRAIFAWYVAHVIQCTFNPHLLSQMTPCDVLRNFCRALGEGTLVRRAVGRDGGVANVAGTAAGVRPDEPVRAPRRAYARQGNRQYGHLTNQPIWDMAI